MRNNAFLESRFLAADRESIRKAHFRGKPRRVGPTFGAWPLSMALRVARVSLAVMRLKRIGNLSARSTIYGRRLEVNLRFFGRLMITEAIAAASKSSKSRSIPADVGSSRFGELDRVREVFVAINASSFRCADVSRRILQVIECGHWILPGLHVRPRGRAARPALSSSLRTAPRSRPAGPALRPW